MFKRCVYTAALVTFAVLSVGCATNTYRIPGAEMQRLAAMPADDRWASIRVVPADESTRHLAAVPTQVTASPFAAPVSIPDPSTPTSVAAEGSALQEEPRLEEPLPRRLPHFCPEDIVIAYNTGPTEPPRFQPREGHVRVAPSVRGTASAPKITAPTRGVPAMPQNTSARRSSSRSGGGGRGGNSPALPSLDDGGGVILAIVGVILVVGLIAAVASAATPDPPFDGWVAVHRNQDLHLHYDHGVRRIVPLNELHPTHLIGLRDTLVIDNAHVVMRLRYAP